jgi:hypothetical protein
MNLKPVVVSARHVKMAMDRWRRAIKLVGNYNN